MGFGLYNALSTLTRLLTHVLDPFIHVFVKVYLDDIYIYSKSAEEHIDHLRKISTPYEEINYLLKWSGVFGLKEKPSILVSSLEVAMFEHPDQKLQ